MLANQIAYVALASNDPAATCAVFERHFGLPRTEFDSSQGSVPVFGLGRSALAVFRLGHPMLDGEAKPGVHHIALGVDDVDTAAKRAAKAGAHRPARPRPASAAARRCCSSARPPSACARA